MTDPHDAIYDLLIEHCGAIEHNRARFREVDLTKPTGWRIGAQLGLDGMFVIGKDGRWFVDCDPRDRKPSVAARIERTNAALAAINKLVA